MQADLKIQSKRTGKNNPWQGPYLSLKSALFMSIMKLFTS